ncbi:hypothetical protein D3C74_304750 [compost metagenome]
MRKSEQSANEAQHIQYVQITWRIISKISLFIELARPQVYNTLAPGDKGIHVILISLRGQTNPDPQDKGRAENHIEPPGIDSIRLLQKPFTAKRPIIEKGEKHTEYCRQQQQLGRRYLMRSLRSLAASVLGCCGRTVERDNTSSFRSGIHLLYRQIIKVGFSLNQTGIAAQGCTNAKLFLPGAGLAVEFKILPIPARIRGSGIPPSNTYGENVCTQSLACSADDFDITGDLIIAVRRDCNRLHPFEVVGFQILNNRSPGTGMDFLRLHREQP